MIGVIIYEIRRAVIEYSQLELSDSVINGEIFAASNCVIRKRRITRELREC